jgi:glutamine phosphoribosylpyrophosphate amidotransferase
MRTFIWIYQPDAAEEATVVVVQASGVNYARGKAKTQFLGRESLIKFIEETQPAHFSEEAIRFKVSDLKQEM